MTNENNFPPRRTVPIERRKLMGSPCYRAFDGCDEGSEHVDLYISKQESEHILLADREELAKLRAALRRYARHLGNCGSIELTPDGGRIVCNCGLEEALQGTSEKEE